jgi:hypothetical protein
VQFYQSVFLHQPPDNQGWQIIGIKKDRSRELLATLAPVLAERWADQAAKNLSGQHSAEID